MQLLVKFAKEKCPDRERDETDRVDMKTHPLWFRSSVETAFVNDVIVVTTASDISQKRPFVDSDDHIRNGYHISRESVPEEMGADSGVEMIAESLKGYVPYR